MRVYTIFTIHGQPIDGLHVTHKFFGELTERETRLVIRAVNQYFQREPFFPFRTTFSKESYFGLMGSVRVLEADNPKLFRMELRNQLDQIKQTVFHPDFKPHVTMPEKKIEVLDADLEDYLVVVDRQPIYSAARGHLC